VLHYLHDVLGSVVALTNSVGQVVERYDYDPYGTTTIMDAAAVPLALKPIDPAAADGYYHDHDRDGDIDAADYTDLMDCVNNTPYDPMCIYTHDRTGDRRVDIVDVGVYLAYADDQGLAGGTSAPELVHYGRPLRLQFDADGDGRVDMFDWYAMQTCFTKNTTRCKYLFDDNGDGVVNFYDLTDFKTAADGPQGGPGATQWRRKLVASRYGNPFMWTGQRYDAITGQYHFWARTYSPSLGRWMQRDPLEYAYGINLSEYVGSRPIVKTDPLGLFAKHIPGYGPLPTIRTKPWILHVGGREIRVWYHGDKPGVVGRNLALAFIILAELGLLDSIPQDFHISDTPELWFDALGTTGKVSNKVTITSWPFEMKADMSDLSWTSILLNNDQIWLILQALVHERAHQLEWRLSRILRLGDGYAGYSAERKLLGIIRRKFGRRYLRGKLPRHEWRRLLDKCKQNRSDIP
jgi:RHS repeat-associated protein